MRACSQCGLDEINCSCVGCSCDHCIEHECTCRNDEPVHRGEVHSSDVDDDADEQLIASHVPTLGDLMKAAKASGLITPVAQYR